MFTKRQGYLYVAVTGLCLSCNALAAVDFQPGVGVAVEYSDNVELLPDNEVSDLITVGYVGAGISENDGPLTYEATTSYNTMRYARNTYDKKSYFNLAAVADWAMRKDRFIWTLRNHFSQLPVNTLEPNTPDNVQNANVFFFGANIIFPVSARQSFSLRPSFSQAYYEVLNTDNKTYALAANWNYLLSQLNTMGLNLSTQKVDYTETDIFGSSITNNQFTNLAIYFNGQRVRSKYSINLGATNVKRDSGEEATGFSGFINWMTDVSSRSDFATLLSTEYTNTGRLTQSLSEDPASGNPGDVQITTGIVRNSVFNLKYLREDASLHSRIWGELRELNYSDQPSDRVIRTYGINLDYPVTQLLVSGAYIKYSRTKLLDVDRLDQYYIAGVNLKYNFSRKLVSSFDVKYRTKESTEAASNFDEFSVFASLVYGFGDVYRPTRVGGY